MSSYLWKGLLVVGRAIIKWKKILPGGLAALFVLVQFFIDLFKYGLVFAFKNLASSLLAAEYQINKAVTLAVQNSPDYGFTMFLSIISSFFILYFFIKWIGKILIGVTGSQARAMAYLVAVVIMGIIEIATVKIVDGSFGFIPVKDGLWFLLVNLGPVLSNIHWF